MELESLKSNLDKLKAGCLFRSIQKESTEPEDIAAGFISKELRFLQRQSEYANEIERVLKELRLTTALIKECETRELISGISRQELLAYYQGVFFTLVHQMKDKVMQLVNIMTEENIPKKPTQEKNIKVSGLLSKKADNLQAIGIEEYIKQWDQENSSSKIAAILKRRTQHHHRISGLKYNRHYLNLNLTDLTANPAFQDQLTDYGKKQMEKMRAESMKCLFYDAHMKAEDTLKEIEENVERISAAIVSYFKLPISQEEVDKIVNERGQMLSSFDVINKSSIDRIQEPQKIMLKALVSKIQMECKSVIAIYLIGSLGRGEYEEGYSDINIYAIFDTDDQQAQVIEKDNVFNLEVFTRAQFLAESSKKYRIIAKADGVLLFGEDLVKNEKLKAGLFLALVLNEDILEIMDQATEWINEKRNATPLEISKKSRLLAKHFIDFIYGVVISNKPQYTSSRAERIEKINEAYPQNKELLDTLVGISRYGVGDSESFINMIDGFRPQVEKNLKKMQELRKSILL